MSKYDPQCEHERTRTVESAFTGCVAQHPYTDCDPRSHGSRCCRETCLDCGETRLVNSNQRWEECGTWGKAR